MRTHGELITAVLAALLSLGLAACGGEGAEPEAEPETDVTETDATDEADAEMSPSPTSTGADAEESPAPAPVSLEGQTNNHGTATLTGDSIAMEMANFYFEPTFVQHDGVSTATVMLRNESDVPHTFTIEDQGVDVVVDPGQRAEATVELPDSGQTPFVCRFHEAQGMQGAFFTEEAGG